jgi:hypothetical protein
MKRTANPIDAQQRAAAIAIVKASDGATPLPTFTADELKALKDKTELYSAPTLIKHTRTDKDKVIAFEYIYVATLWIVFVCKQRFAFFLLYCCIFFLS